MSLIKPYRNGFQKGFNSYPGTNEKTGIEFDILITDKDEEHEFGEKENEIGIDRKVPNEEHLSTLTLFTTIVSLNKET